MNEVYRAMKVLNFVSNIQIDSHDLTISTVVTNFLLLFLGMESYKRISRACSTDVSQ